jgi:ketosteroid isomerase-like protein
MARAMHDTLRAIMGAYLQGDLEPLMAIASDDIVWDSNARRSQFRFGGVFKGRIGLQEALSIIASEFAMLKYDVREIVGEGDTMWALSDVVLSEHKTGKRANFRLTNRWQFKDGKLVQLTEFFDTGGVLADLGRL